MIKSFGNLHVGDTIFRLNKKTLELNAYKITKIWCRYEIPYCPSNVLGVCIIMDNGKIRSFMPFDANKWRISNSIFFTDEKEARIQIDKIRGCKYLYNLRNKHLNIIKKHLSTAV